MKKVEKDIVVSIPFYDVDSMSVVWHGNYVKYCEDVRCALLDKIGYNYNEMANDGLMYPVAKMKMKFIKSMVFTQKVVLKAILEEYEPALIIKYEFMDYNTKELLFCAKTMQICVDAKTKQSCYQVPQKLKEGIERCLQE